MKRRITKVKSDTYPHYYDFGEGHNARFYMVTGKTSRPKYHFEGDRWDSSLSFGTEADILKRPVFKKVTRGQMLARGRSKKYLSGPIEI